MPKTSAGRTIFYGWFIVATTFMIAALTTGPRNGLGVFVVPMSTDFGWSRSTVSLAAAMGFLVNGLSQPFLGRLFDRFGGRKVIMASLATFGVGTILLSLTFHIIFFILLFGLALSIAWSGASLTTLNALLARWFQRKRATVLGLSTAGASAGGLLLIPLAMYLLHLTDWRMTWVALGATILVLALPLAFFFLQDDPRDLGLLPDGEQDSAGDRQTDPSRAVRGPLETDSWRTALGSLPFWQLTGAYFVCGFTTAMLTTHFIPYAIDRGFASSTAAAAFALMSGLNVAGVIVAGALADRFGRKNLLACVYAARGGAYAMLVIAPGPWSLWGFAAIAGFSYWATAPLTTSLTADVYGLRSLGTLNGLTFLIHQVGGAASIQFAGLMRDLTGSYTIPFAIAGMLLIPAALSAFSVREQTYSVKYQHLPNPAGS
ncbi:MAG TPA: MFS transporter [Alphaproteobacteria bacterium]|nr:MFS transporter [Alphaproteobacteria bacterium]